ncbi:hypothetical protein HJ590_00845 [Naumannella sp. ID2617S]|nr:hypothetical protein [Naumannella sp. ID2617S]
MTAQPGVGRARSFVDCLTLAADGDNSFVGRSLPSPIERVFGGQAVGQALAAAQLTVDEAYAPHSLHDYLLRGGAVDVPIRYDVDRLRDGRGFCNRLVTASQDGKPILTLSASFHRGDRGPRTRSVDRWDRDPTR